MKDHRQILWLLPLALSILVYFLPSWRAQIHKESDIDLLSVQHHDALLQSSGSFLMYYAPWCSVCEDTLPIYRNVQQALSKSNVSTTAVNCETFKDLCTQDLVPIFPTFKFVKDGFADVYNGPREEKDMIEYATIKAAQ